MKLFRYFAAIFLLFLFSNKIFSQTTNAYDFLRLDLNPRAAAVAGSYVANSDDPNVIFYNPAGINMLENLPVSFSYVSQWADISLAGLSLSKNFENIGHFGLGINYINYGTMSRRDEMNNDLGSFHASEVAFMLAYGNNLDENFLYGATVKYIYSGIESASSAGIGFDLGLQYVIPSQKLNIGFSVLNMGTQVKKYFTTKEDLPLDVRLGISKKMERIPLILYFSFNKLNEDKTNFLDRLNAFTFGGEVNLSKGLRLRIGYDNEKRQDFKIGGTAGLAGFNIGVGAVIKSYNFDYSYSSFGLAGAINRIGITTSF